MFFCINLSSKYEKELLNLVNVLNQKNWNPSHLTQFPKKTNRQFITILKSPHVNKIAQEQFEYRIFNFYIFEKSFQSLKQLVLLKKLQEQLFSGVKITLTFYIFKTYNHFKMPQIVSLKSFDLKHHYIDKKRNPQSLKGWVSILDIKGELLLQKCYFSG